MELALAVAADTTWPVRVRRTALLLVSVLCRGSQQSAKHFLQLGVCAGHCQPACLPDCLCVCRRIPLFAWPSVCLLSYDVWDACV